MNHLQESCDHPKAYNKCAETPPLSQAKNAFSFGNSGWQPPWTNDMIVNSSFVKCFCIFIILHSYLCWKCKDIFAICFASLYPSYATNEKDKCAHDPPLANLDHLRSSQAKLLTAPMWPVRLATPISPSRDKSCSHCSLSCVTVRILRPIPTTPKAQSSIVMDCKGTIVIALFLYPFPEVLIASPFCQINSQSRKTNTP